MGTKNLKEEIAMTVRATHPDKRHPYVFKLPKDTQDPIGHARANIAALFGTSEGWVFKEKKEKEHIKNALTGSGGGITS